MPTVNATDARMADGCRSAWQECALVVSLEMFNVLLERCNALLKEQLESGNQTANNRLLGEDLQIILPAIKVHAFLHSLAGVFFQVSVIYFVFRYGATGSCATASFGIRRQTHATITSGKCLFIKLFLEQQMFNKKNHLSSLHSPSGTPWTRLATLINLLSKFDTRAVDISTRPMEGAPFSQLSLE